MLEKNKDYIEFKAACCVADYRQYDMDKLEIAGYVNADLAIPLPNPGTDYILISKDKFDRLQAKVSFSEELAKQWETNYNLLLKKTGFETVEELINYIYDDGPNSQRDWKTLKEIIDDAEDDYISERDKAEDLQTENEQLKKKLHEFDPVLEWFFKYTDGGQVSVNGWAESAKYWKKRYDDIFKLVGFSSKDEVEDYLVNEAECDTLHEATLKLINENKYACEEWCKANSSNNSWKAAAECDSPKELIEKLNLLRDTIEYWHDRTTDIGNLCADYRDQIKAWKEGTGCPSPSEVKTLIESGMSWHHAYNEIKKANEKLADDVKSWKNVTGYSTPKSCLSDRIHNVCMIQKWKEATSCSTPEEAKELIGSKNGGIVELKNKLDASLTENEQLKEKYDQAIELIGEWQRATVHFQPKAADEELVKLKKEVSDYKEQIQSLFKVIGRWQEVTGCKTPEETKDWVANLGEANGNLAQAVLSWQEVTGCKTPEDAKDYWTAKLSESDAVNETFAREFRSWQEITGFSTPEKCSSYIDTLEQKLEDIKNLIEED